MPKSSGSKKASEKMVQEVADKVLKMLKEELRNERDR
jgi:hypothetical protein